MAQDVFAYQDEAAKIIASHRRFGLFDAMGVGKTATEIRTQDYRHIRGQGGIEGLVICPAAIRENWRKEWLRFQTVNRRIIKIDTIYDLKAWLDGHFDVGLMSFERAASFAPYFEQACKPIDFCILDEAHYLKNPTSKRAKAILGEEFDGRGGILQWAVHADWVTGTPVPNDPADIWTFLRFLDGPMTLTNLGFKKKYLSVTPTQYGCKTRPKTGKTRELSSLIKQHSIARSMQDVGIQLPPIWLTTTTVEGNVKDINSLLQQFPGLDERILEHLRDGGDISGLDDEHVAALRRMLGETKATPYAHMLAEELKSGLDKVVIFGHHRLALQQIGEYLNKKGFRGVAIQGGTSEDDRGEAVSQFNGDPKCRFFLGNHRAAGVGLNLQESCCRVDIFESDWTPAANAQSIKRVARYGQKRSMTARFITLNHWLEESIQQINKDKTERVLSLGLPELL